MRAMIVCVAMAAGMAAAAEEPAPIPKEGTGSSTGMGSATMKALPMGKDRIQLAWEFLGAVQADEGKGLLHNASVRCIGSVLAVNGDYQSYTNSCAFTRPDGDQVFTSETATGKTGGTSRGTATVVGGTGKLAGITGAYEFTRWVIRPAADGTFQSVTRSKLSYKLP